MIISQPYCHILGNGLQNAGMPRQLRVQYSGAIYHVMNRGDRRENIFEEEHRAKGAIHTSLGPSPQDHEPNPIKR